MNEKQLRELLNKELDLKVPDLDDKILSTPIHVIKEEKVSWKTSFENILKNKKTWAWTAAVACVIIVLLCAIIIPINMNTNSVNQYTCYVVDINPCVAITVDGDDNVVSVSAINEDGNLVLSSDSIVVDSDVDACVTSIIDCAAQLGYIDTITDDNAINITAINSKQGKLEGLLTERKDATQQFLMENGIYGVVLTEAVSLSDMSSKLKYNNCSTVRQLMMQLENREKFTYQFGNFDDRLSETRGYLQENYMNNYCEKTNLIIDLMDDFKSLNDQIKEISGLTTDYWSMKDYAGDNEQLKSLISQASEILSSLDEYGVAGLDNKNTFEEETKSMEYISRYFSNKGYGPDQMNPDQILQFFNGKDDRAYKEFGDMMNDIPTNPEIFMEHEGTRISNEYEKKKAEFSEQYSQNRTVISAEDYQTYLNNIISNYGSIEDYYNKLKNN